MFLIETKSNVNRLEMVKQRIGFWGCMAINSLGSKGGLALIWRSGDRLAIDTYS